MASGSATADNKGEKRDEDSGSTRAFECNICLDTAHDAVVSMCGHLFCWPCLHRWMETKHPRSDCPVCKAAISKEKVIPIYGRGVSNKEDPREKVPPRPSGQRTEPEQNNGNVFTNFFGGGGGPTDGGFQMSFGIGAFPFGLFATTFNLTGGGGVPQAGMPGMGSAQPHQTGPGSPDPVYSEESQFMSKVFLAIAMICILWLIMA